ncbi:MAG: PorT family protein, partial [Lewinella sp.]|nr:PorT family protein [Lewinella sp.]
QLLLLSLGLFFLTTGGLLRAQTFSAMVVGGFNLAQIDGDDLLGFRKLGVNAGLRANTHLSERWTISLEMLFSQQGANRGVNDPLGSGYDKIHLNLVDVPLMINFSDWKVQASAGISYGRIVNYRVEDVFGEDITELEDYRPAVFALNFGGTFFFTEDWGLNLRWSKYLTDLRADPGDGTLLGRNVSIRLLYQL